LKILTRKVNFLKFSISKDLSFIIEKNPGYVSSSFEKDIWEDRQDLFDDEDSEDSHVEPVDVFYVEQERRNLKKKAKEVQQYIIDTHPRQLQSRRTRRNRGPRMTTGRT
jgi:hypothetical protein